VLQVLQQQERTAGVNFHHRLAADPFRPHEFRTAQVFLRHFSEPKIFITPDAYADMLAIAENSGSDEIGWLGTVTELGDARYLIDSAHMPAQAVHGATCELTEDGIGELFTELATTDFEACERMHFWGHVHPGNSTSPSSQDEEQMNQFAHNDWFIRGIFGRQSRAEFTFFDYRNGVRWNDVPWAIHCPVSEERRAKWAAEVAAKVEKIVVPAFPAMGGGHYPFAAGPNRSKTISTFMAGGNSGEGRRKKKKK
jgi:hypothetical protein